VPPPLSGWRALLRAVAWHRRGRVVYQIAPAKSLSVCFCGGIGHPLPQGAPKVVGGGDAWLEPVIQRT
jgi:hypothetical protein